MKKGKNRPTFEIMIRRLALAAPFALTLGGPAVAEEPATLSDYEPLPLGVCAPNTIGGKATGENLRWLEDKNGDLYAELCTPNRPSPPHNNEEQETINSLVMAAEKSYEEKCLESTEEGQEKFCMDATPPILCDRRYGIDKCTRLPEAPTPQPRTPQKQKEEAWGIFQEV